MSCLQLQYIQICFLLTVTVHYHIGVQLSARQGSVSRAFHLFCIYIYAISTDPNIYEVFSKPFPVRFLANPEGFEFLRAWCLYPWTIFTYDDDYTPCLMFNDWPEWYNSIWSCHRNKYEMWWSYGSHTGCSRTWWLSNWNVNTYWYNKLIM